MALDLTVDELLTTTRSVRRRLDFGKPVRREELMECLQLALQAPTAAGAQGWRWVFVEEPEKKAALPHDEYSQAGLFPIAHTIGTYFRPATRLAPELVTHWNSW